jgi:TPR repeat protein
MIAAEAGYVEAIYNIANHYRYGEGVEQNSSIAHEWMLKAANQGHPNAMLSVASYYYFTLFDKEKGVNWYIKAAEAGVAIAQFNVASFYSTGTVLEKDLNKAREWLTKAANQGYEEAIKMLKELD